MPSCSQSVPRDLGRVFRTPEHVNHVDSHLLRDIQERRIHALAEHLRLVRVDRDDPIAVLLEVGRHPVGRSPLFRGRADDRDHARLPQQ
jgi:hypothetical protein